jgi:glycosyltransferase involved in cell wall biosynthesis
VRARGHGAVRQAADGVTAGFFSPLPPARTGVADYAASLLRALRHRGTVEVAPARCDVALYHTGNNQLHAAIYDRALAHPGVVVVHDAVLQHFLLGRLERAAYVEEFVYNYGEWSRGLAEDMWRGRASSGTAERYFAYPMLKRLVESARAVVVHNPAAAEAVRRHAPKTPVVEIPHLFEPVALPSLGETMRWRQRCGIAPGAYLFGVFGYLRESKRLFSVLEAFDRLYRENGNVALLVAGDFVSSDLERAAGPLLGRPGIARVPFLEEAGFRTAAAAVDACINLRYPAAGETSGIAVRLMGMGKPVLLTDATEAARYPEAACIRIPGGPAEREALWQYMVLLTSKADISREIGQRAADHVRLHHSLDAAADLYWKTLCDYRS